MSNQELQSFLNIIDGRIKKYINDSRLLKQYCGTITGEVEGEKGSPSKYKVKLLGYPETEFIFLNKSGEVLSVNDKVYIQTVGTDLNTGVIMHKTKESFDSYDCVVEQGTQEINKTNGNGTWHYRKWASGIAECWGRFSRTNVPSTDFNAWGTMYVTKAVSSTNDRISYPFTFIETPIETVRVEGSNLALFAYTHTNGKPTTTASGNYRACRPVEPTTNTNINLDIYTIGKWK